jgi:hypothetical protein
VNAELSDFFKAPEGTDRGRLNEPAKKDASLVDGYCSRCDQMVLPLGVIYPDDHPEASPDGVGVVSEWECPRCRRREGRWTGSVLTDGSSEPLNGEEDESKIVHEQLRFELGSQPR